MNLKGFVLCDVHILFWVRYISAKQLAVNLGCENDDVIEAE